MKKKLLSIVFASTLAFASFQSTPSRADGGATVLIVLANVGTVGVLCSQVKKGDPAYAACSYVQPITCI